MDYWCCLMGICCAFGSVEQTTKLVAMRMKDGASKESAEQAVKFDLVKAKAFRERMQAS